MKFQESRYGGFTGLNQEENQDEREENDWGTKGTTVGRSQKLVVWNSGEKRRETERADEKGRIPRGIPVVSLICVDLVRDKLSGRSNWANCQRAETPAAQSIDCTNPTRSLTLCNTAELNLISAKPNENVNWFCIYCLTGSNLCYDMGALLWRNNFVQKNSSRNWLDWLTDRHKAGFGPFLSFSMYLVMRTYVNAGGHPHPWPCTLFVDFMSKPTLRIYCGSIETCSTILQIKQTLALFKINWGHLTLSFSQCCSGSKNFCPEHRLKCHIMRYITQ